MVLRLDLLCRVVRRSVLISGLFVLTVCGSAHAQVLRDSFRDNSLGWSSESRAGNFGIPTGSDVRFGFDYSTLGIPEAPRSLPGDDPQLGVRLRTNLIGVSEDQVAIFLDSPQIAGKYQLQVDMWLNWAPDPNEIGTTLHSGVFVGNSTPDNPTESLKPISRGAGALFSSDGDCSNCDYILLKNEAELDLYSGQYSVYDFGFGNQPGIDNTDATPSDFNGDGFIDAADYTAWRDDLGAGTTLEDYELWTQNYGFPTFDAPGVFPSFDLAEAVDEMQDLPIGQEQITGALGFQWVTVTVDVDPFAIGEGPTGVPGKATFRVTNANTGASLLLGTVDNSVVDDPDDGHDSTEGPVSMEGRVSLALIDFFSGGAADLNLGFVLYDNLTITTEAVVVPEPASGIGLATGMLCLFALRRNSRRR